MSYAPCPLCKAGYKTHSGTLETKRFNCDSVLHVNSGILEQSKRCKRLEATATCNGSMSIIPLEEATPCAEDILG